MLIQRKVKATQRCVVHVHKATYSYYICAWCDVGVHYAITDYMYIQVLVLLVGAYRDQMCICIVRNALMCIRLGSTIFGQ